MINECQLTIKNECFKGNNKLIDSRFCSIDGKKSLVSYFNFLYFRLIANIIEHENNLKKQQFKLYL